MLSEYLAEPKAAPGLDIPDSTSTVDVRVIDTHTLIYIKPSLFLEPKLNSFPGFHVPVYCFLISHNDRHVLFDLGVRHDWENYPPHIASLLKQTTDIIIGQDVASFLTSRASELAVQPRDISAIIWSHNHWDHTGDPSVFPPSTDLVVGPGTARASWPGYPSNPQGIVHDSAIAGGRRLVEVDFPADGLRIGRFRAHDFFGDGSFYLLDAPGHAPGHMCALARVTPSPGASFVLLGADACHHPGALRPTPWTPLPRDVPFAGRMHESPCPGEALLEQLLAAARENGNGSEDVEREHKHGDSASIRPIFTPARTFLFPDHDAAVDTVNIIQELDASEDVFVIIAHDASLQKHLPVFPDTLNSWKERGLKTETRWNFCSDFDVLAQHGHQEG